MSLSRVKLGHVRNADRDGCHLAVVCVHRCESFPKRFARAVEINRPGCHVFMYLQVLWVTLNGLRTACKNEPLTALSLCSEHHVVCANNIHWHKRSLEAASGLASAAKWIMVSMPLHASRQLGRFVISKVKLCAEVGNVCALMSANRKSSLSICADQKAVPIRPAAPVIKTFS